jgi:hypothetical protein
MKSVQGLKEEARPSTKDDRATSSWVNRKQSIDNNCTQSSTFFHFKSRKTVLNMVALNPRSVDSYSSSFASFALDGKCAPTQPVDRRCAVRVWPIWHGKRQKVEQKCHLNSSQLVHKSPSRSLWPGRISLDLFIVASLHSLGKQFLFWYKLQNNCLVHDDNFCLLFILSNLHPHHGYPFYLFLPMQVPHVFVQIRATTKLRRKVVTFKWCHPFARPSKVLHISSRTNDRLTYMHLLENLVCIFTLFSQAKNFKQTKKVQRHLASKVFFTLQRSSSYTL